MHSGPGPGDPLPASVRIADEPNPLILGRIPKGILFQGGAAKWRKKEFLQGISGEGGEVGERSKNLSSWVERSALWIDGKIGFRNEVRISSQSPKNGK